MALRRCSQVLIFHKLLPVRKPNPSILRQISSCSEPPYTDLEAMLHTPSWSVKSLFQSDPSAQDPPVTQRQLHELLRLSALPLPTSDAQEEKMIADLKSQLKFVRAIQSVDTTNIEPLQSIRDETKEAEMEQQITVATLEDEFKKEEVVGIRGRIRRNEPRSTVTQPDREWDPLAQAPKRLGRFFVVDTAKD